MYFFRILIYSVKKKKKVSTIEIKNVFQTFMFIIQKWDELILEVSLENNGIWRQETSRSPNGWSLSPFSIL